MAVPINMTTRLARLHCHDEGDGWGNAAPYLWAVFFKIDGDSYVVQQGAGLIGSPIIVSSNGSHGNLGDTDVDAGDDVAIPEAIGSFSTVLKPIPVNDPFIASLLPDGNLPGITGVVVAAMEEDGWPHSLANDGYSAFVNAVHLAVVKVAADFQNATHAPTPEEITAAVDQVKASASASVRTQVKGSMDGWELLWFGTFGDNDDSIGTEAFTTDCDALEAAPDIDFARRWDEDEAEDGDWELFGWFSGNALPVIPGGCNLDGLFARTAADERVKDRSFDALRKFRDTTFREYPGLAAWWSAAMDAAPELAHLAGTDEQVQRSLEHLLAEAPRLLEDPREQVRPEDVAAGRLILQRLAAVSPLQAMRFARQAVRAFAKIDGLSWGEALDFMSRAKPRGRTLRKRAQR
ncbi:hypothetical protein FHS29_004802 [Saccharothrix tamanrassetensis]|uniref:Uncharacterized protein n=1 Tax=Saccharothrix tamanrassetensis TaxID=1051531 RepID=A0A841CPA4_9PSEU|nr:hypothetical protein [Saccharothrix tamanrassetensis]MBB5958194.1 hypothetical protein [Saccharothrix tamanrassetensis]